MTQPRPLAVIDDYRPVQTETAPAPLRLLHVEDNPADAALMQEYLRGVLADVQFDTAQRMSELTTKLAESADCALLDLSLPDATGLDALIALRVLSDVLPIIVLTGFDDLELGLSALRFGADDYLVKNHVDGFTLDRAVRYAIERRRLLLDVARELADSTIATATGFNAEAALEASHRPDSRDGRAAEVARSLLPTMAGTHEVKVRIDAETHEYVLSCRSCDWEAGRGPSDLHSWADRSLERTLIRHVAFGDVPEATEQGGGEPVVQRRSLFHPQRWLPSASAERAADPPGGAPR